MGQTITTVVNTPSSQIANLLGNNTWTGTNTFSTISSPTLSSYLLLAGRSTGQTVYGGTSASEGLTLGSTAHATKGNIILGTSVYDELNNRLGLGVNAPAQRLDVAYGHQRFTRVVEPTAATATLKAATPGNIDNGAHIYKISYTTANGETALGTVSNTVTVTDKTVGGQVDLTAIPVSTNPNVTQRKIYRTKAAGATYFLLTTIANNTATTYTDNTADASLGADDALNRVNSTAGIFYIDAINSGRLHYGNVGFGYSCMAAISTGFHNTALGLQALAQANTGSYNVCLGVQTGYGITNGAHNLFIGTYAGYQNASGSYNVGFGSFSLGGLANFNYTVGIGMSAGRYNTGSGNVFIGYVSGWTGSAGANATTSGTYNTYIGYATGQAGASATQRSKCIAIGYNATVDADNTCAIGGTGADAVKVVIGATTARDTFDVVGTMIANGYKSSDGSAGATGSFTTVDLKTCTVKNGLIVSIV